jgi:branched-chain amino acid transport system ATP-binding protein
MLEITGLHAHYGHIEALHGVSLQVGRGQIVSIIGANGAGKSTLLMTICGRPKASAGQILFDGEPLNDLAPHEIVGRGIAQAPEGRRIFSSMSVLENLQMGAVPTNGAFFDEDVQEVFALFPRLQERQRQRGGTLSGGEQQMLCIGRALMARPRLLLLDEPSLGLAPLLVRQIFAAIVEINRKRDVTILLVEQNAYQALRIATYGYVLATGRVVLEGGSRDLLANPEIRAAYLEGGH